MESLELKLLRGGWDSNLGPLVEQQVLFFKLLSHFFSFHVPFKIPEAVNGKAKDHC